MFILSDSLLYRPPMHAPRHSPTHSPDFGGESGNLHISDMDTSATLAAETSRRIESLVPTVHITGAQALRYEISREHENPTGARLLVSTSDRRFFLLAARKRTDHPELQLVGKNLDLSNANLAGLYLEDAVLAGCDLSGADLRGTNMMNADIAKANLDNMLIGVPSTEFVGVDFEAARFERVRLHVEDNIGPQVFASVAEVAPDAAVGRIITLDREKFLAFVRSYVGDTV